MTNKIIDFLIMLVAVPFAFVGSIVGLCYRSFVVGFNFDWSTGRAIHE